MGTWQYVPTLTSHDDTLFWFSPIQVETWWNFQSIWKTVPLQSRGISTDGKPVNICFHVKKDMNSSSFVNPEQRYFSNWAITLENNTVTCLPHEWLKCQSGDTGKDACQPITCLHGWFAPSYTDTTVYWFEQPCGKCVLLFVQEEYALDFSINTVAGAPHRTHRL